MYAILTESVTSIKGEINVLTDNGEINFQVSRRRVSKIDPAPVDTLVTLSKILKCQLRRRARTKRCPVAPKMRGAPKFRLSELATSRVVTATPIAEIRQQNNPSAGSIWFSFYLLFDSDISVPKLPKLSNYQSYKLLNLKVRSQTRA